MRELMADLSEILPAWYYRLAPFLAMNLIDEPAILALAFC